MSDPLDSKAISGAFSNGRNRSIRFIAGRESGDVFGTDVEFDGFTLTVEVSGEEDARAMIEAIAAIKDAP